MVSKNTFSLWYDGTDLPPGRRLNQQFPNQ